MNCQDIDKILSLYIDDMLDEESKEGVTSHIKNCKKCSQKLSELKFTLSLLKELPKEELPLGFQERLRENLQRENKAKSGRWRRGVMALVAAMAIVIVVKSGIYDISRKDIESRYGTDGQMQYNLEDDIAPSQETKKADEDGQEPIKSKGYTKEAEEEDKDIEEPLQVDMVLTEEVVVRAQDICTNPQAVEKVALIYDIEVLEVREDRIIVKVDTEDKRNILYTELSKLGEVENLGSDEKSTRIEITIETK